MGKNTVPNVKTAAPIPDMGKPSRHGLNGISGFTPMSPAAQILISNQRTATERINNRILNDYGLHRIFIHTKEHYSFMTTIIGICIHLDARYKQHAA